MAFRLPQALARSAVRGFILGNNGHKPNLINMEVAAVSAQKDLPLSMAALNINSIRIPPYIEHPKIRIPLIPLPPIVEQPKTQNNIAYEDKSTSQPLEEPNPLAVTEKQAARLIVIRRKKMKKHKLKKLRMKMKFVWAKMRQRRELRKEKRFQAHLLGAIKVAQSFDPAKYAADKIARAKEVELPQVWYGIKYPEHVIKELIKEEEQKKQEKIADEKRRASMSPYVKDYLDNLPK